MQAQPPYPGGWAVSRYVMETDFTIIWPSPLAIVIGGVTATQLECPGNAVAAFGMGV